MNYKIFLYIIFSSINCVPVYSVTLPVILDNLQEEILHIARNRDIDDNNARDAMVSAVEKARARAELGFFTDDFDKGLRELLMQQIAALAKTKLTKLDNLKYALCAGAASGIAFFMLKQLLLGRKEHLELRSYYSRNYQYYSPSYNRYDEDEYFKAVVSFALGGGVAGLSSLMWFKDALLGNQDALAHDRLVLLKVALY